MPRRFAPRNDGYIVFALERTLTYRTPKPPTDDAPPFARTEEIVLTWRYTNSDVIGKVLFPRLRGSSTTIAKDGTLIVLMKKIDGTWRWNPFGW